MCELRSTSIGSTSFSCFDMVEAGGVAVTSRSNKMVEQQGVVCFETRKEYTEGGGGRDVKCIQAEGSRRTLAKEAGGLKEGKPEGTGATSSFGGVLCGFCGLPPPGLSIWDSADVPHRMVSKAGIVLDTREVRW